ncbi:threonine transporter [Candidatus Poribacteria bacterium]|nr:threonine transporter [Gammaproteobacteria bacterium]MYF99198.1 threonine transporter [Candidatus Poribacteria bacterium]
MTGRKASPFNSALETGVRALSILTASYPKVHDLGRLVQYDYLTVHSADANGPPSLHPPLPLRSGELLVRRGLIESGLRLMMSRSLVRRELHANGFLFGAEDSATSFLDNLSSPYSVALRNRADWVATTFDELSVEQLDSVVKRLFEAWTIEFQPSQTRSQAELPL